MSIKEFTQGYFSEQPDYRYWADDYVNWLDFAIAGDDKNAYETLAFEYLESYSKRKHGEEEVMVLRERPGFRISLPLVAARTEANGVVYQAPHARRDTHSEVIAEYLFDNTMASGLMISTQKRDFENPSLHDPANDFHAVWQAATERFCQLVPSPVLAQIHGFSRSKRDTPEGQAADIIVSAGVDYDPDDVHSSYAERVVNELRLLFPDLQVYLYGRDVQELGAKGNIQGPIARAYGQFLHLEFVFDVRDKILLDENGVPVASELIKIDQAILAAR